jgi:hypothetical protein
MPRQHTATVLCIAASFCFLTAAIAADKPNLSGTWKMNVAKSETGSSEIKSRVDKIDHQDPQLKITTTQDDENGGNTVVRDYVTDGRQMTHSILGGERKSSARWDGNVLVIETKVTEGGYTIRDRWTLADDHKSIRIDREFSGNQGGTTRHILLEKQ